MQTNEFDLDPKELWRSFKQIFWSDENKSSDNNADNGHNIEDK